jgi:diguanylate cyclase (GGDEF)-like protein/PAS domain S-box-containing protein
MLLPMAYIRFRQGERAMSYTPLIWPFVGSLLVTIALAWYAWHRRQAPLAMTFTWLMAALTYWTCCYLLELMSTTLAGKAFWVAAKYPGSTAGPVLFFVLALQLTKHDHWLTWPVRMALWAFGVLTCAIVFTNDLHHWFWQSIHLVPGLPETVTEKGFVFWIYAALVYLFTLTSAVLFFRYYRTTPSYYRRQALLMTLGGFVPLAGRLLEDVFGIDVIPVVDNVILLLLLSGLLFALAIFRYGALNIIHIAHNLVIQNIQAGIIVLDIGGRVVELNPFARTLLSLRDAHVIGQPVNTLVPNWPTLALAAGVEREVAVQHGEHEVWCYLQGSLIRADNGPPAGYVFVLFDITARKNAERQLEQLARTDPLTGSINRRSFFELAQDAGIRAQRYDRPLSLVMLDIDHFKQVNDEYGHQAGDAVLKHVAATCQKHMRASDLFARYGGEEFICLLSEGGREAAVALAERLRVSIEQTQVVFDTHIIRVTLSLGVAYETSGGEQSLMELTSYADRMLYQSKANGRNRVTVAAISADAGATHEHTA